MGGDTLDTGGVVDRIILDDSAFQQRYRELFGSYGEKLTALIDARIELALADARRKALDLYRQGRDGVPEPADVPAGEVDRVVDGARGGLVSPESGDPLRQVAHDLAPSSLAGTESVEPAAPNSSASGAAGTPGGAS